MKRAPTSLKARVGPWNSSSEKMLSSTLTAGTSKLSVSQTISLRSSAGMSSPKNESATRQAISRNVMFCMLEKNSSSRGFMRSGIYKPLSSASPLTTAFSREARGAFPLVL